MKNIEKLVKKVNIVLPVVLGLILSIAFVQYTNNLYEEASTALNIPEIYLWMIMLFFSMLVIVAFGIPTSTEEIKLFASPFALVMAVYSGYHIFVLFNDEVGRMLDLPLSMYYLLLMFVVIMITLFFLIFARITNARYSTKSKNKSKTKKSGN